MFGRRHRNIWESVFRYLEFDTLQMLLQMPVFADQVQMYSRVRFFETVKRTSPGIEPNWFGAWLTQIPNTPLWLPRRSDLDLIRGNIVVCMSQRPQMFIRNDWDWELYPASYESIETCATCAHSGLSRLMNFCRSCMDDFDNRHWMLCNMCSLVCSECNREMCVDHARAINRNTNVIVGISHLWTLNNGHIMQWCKNLVGFELVCIKCLKLCERCHEYRHDINPETITVPPPACSANCCTTCSKGDPL